MSGTWCTIESDPGVFTELIDSIGVQGVQMEELYSLDESSFSRLRPVYGLVFLFKWTGEDQRIVAEARNEEGLFFARQVIPNACATQAILSVLLNCADKVDIGETLSDFLAFTRDFPPEMKGLAISNSERIRSVHNGFCRQEPFFDDGNSTRGKEEDAFHFVAYVPHHGKVFELDGLKSGPIALGDVPSSAGDADDGGSGNGSDDWLSVASPAIEERISRYSSGEIRFNLMAIVKNRKQVATEARERCKQRVEALDRVMSVRDGAQNLHGDALSAFEMGRVERESQRAAELRNVDECNFTIALEEAKFAQWRKENMRRKHDYVPFGVNFLKAVANKTSLQKLIESAASKVQEREDGKTSPRKKLRG